MMGQEAGQGMGSEVWECARGAAPACVVGVLLATAVPAPPAVAQPAQEDEDAARRSWFLEASGGAEYDSVVALDELDLSNDSGDSALLLELSGGVTQPFGRQTELDLRYSYSVLDYSDFPEVDQESHILSADLKRDVGAADIGFSTFYIDSDLGNDQLLELVRFSPYVSGFFRKGWFARAAFVYSDKVNGINPGRDATASIAELDIYHFPSGKPWYVSLGYKYRDEGADAARFDYTGNTLKVRWVRRMQLAGRDARLELSYRYLDRDYSAITPSIGDERRDQRQQLQAEMELTLSERLNLELFGAYADYESNLAGVDFDQYVTGFRLRYRWEP